MFFSTICQLQSVVHSSSKTSRLPLYFSELTVSFSLFCFVWLDNFIICLISLNFYLLLMQILDDDYSKLAFLCTDWSVCLHLKYGKHHTLWIPRFSVYPLWFFCSYMVLFHASYCICFIIIIIIFKGKLNLSNWLWFFHVLLLHVHDFFLFPHENLWLKRNK